VVHAERTQYALTGCGFTHRSHQDSALVTNRRVLITQGEVARRVRFSRRVDRVECRDTDGDNQDEVIGYARNGSYEIVQIAPRSIKSLSAVCRRVRSLKSGEIYKSIASRHIPDQRKLSTSFITVRGAAAPRNNCLYVYDRRGTLIHTLGQYFPTGIKYSSRYYGGHGCGDLKSAASIAATASRNTGSPEGFITSGTGNCARIPNLNSCFNSSAC